MDGSRFDHLTRSLAGVGSRRGFVAGVLGLGAGLAGPRLTMAACPPGQVSVRGVCRCKLTGRPPVGGVCSCPTGQTDHGDGLGCVPDCLVDGAPCGVGRVCIHGVCQGNGACTAVSLNCAPASSCDGTATFGSANLCLETLAGGLICIATDTCVDLASCGPGGECPAGTVCLAACDRLVCGRVCGAT